MTPPRDHTVVDSDGHVFEPPDLWQRYMPASLRARAPKPLSADWLSPYLEIDGKLYPRPERQPEEAYHERKRDDLDKAQEDKFSARSQLAGMDQEGIGAAALFPSRGLCVMGMDTTDPTLGTAMAEAYNRWLHEFCSTNPKRLYGVAMIDPRDPEGARKEARRAIKEYGFVGAFLRPNPVAGKPWHDPVYDPLWSELEDLDAPICFHEGGSVYLPQVATDRFREHSWWHACTHPMENQMAMLSMLLGGVAERHPKLRMAFVECGAGWLPYWLWRLDEHFENEPDNFAHLKLSPSEYAVRQCFVSIDSDEQPGMAAIAAGEKLGGHRIVWGSDYPHPDSKFPNALKTLASLDGMNPARLKSILSDAPRDLFGAHLAHV